MYLQHIGHGGISNGVADVGQGSLGPIKSPRRILSGKANNGNDDFLADAWPSRFPFVAGVELPGHEIPVPPQHGVRREDGCQFQQRFAADGVRLDSQQSTLVVVEQQSLLAKLL